MDEVKAVAGLAFMDDDIAPGKGLLPEQAPHGFQVCVRKPAKERVRAQEFQADHGFEGSL